MLQNTLYLLTVLVCLVVHHRKIVVLVRTVGVVSQATEMNRSVIKVTHVCKNFLFYSLCELAQRCGRVDYRW